MNKLAVPSILAATLLVAGIFSLAPIDKASTVHTTITATTVDQDRWITGTITDYGPISFGTNITRINVTAPGSANQFDIAGGYLAIDETDAEATARVALVCDEDGDGDVSEAADVIANAGVDTIINFGATADCRQIRIFTVNYDDAGDTVDIYYGVNVDSNTD